MVYFRLDISHALIDAASISVILDNLGRAYTGQLQPGAAPLYSNYIDYIQARPLEASINYWANHLDGLDPCHFPLLSEGIEEKKDGKLSSISVDLGDVSTLLRAFCDSNSVTISNYFQTIWGLVLQAYTGTSDVCFGYLASGRDIPINGIEETVGPFINMLVCRVNVGQSSTVSQLVRQTHSNYTAALEHQHCPLAMIHHRLHLSDRPLFNTLMSVHHAPSGTQEQGDISFSSVGSHDPTEVSIHPPTYAILY
jgi:hypothetical protein